MILIIDNYDSFTYNLMQYAGMIANDVVLYKNDNVKIKALDFKQVSHIIISPGPGLPHDSNLSHYVLAIAEKEKIPLLGVCLGHQLIAMYYGAKIIKAKNIMHGKLSKINIIKKCEIYKGIETNFFATRYHSLIIDSNKMPNSLRITSIDDVNNEIMGLHHKNLPIYGIQFHPESIQTKCGYKMIENFLNIVV